MSDIQFELKQINNSLREQSQRAREKLEGIRGTIGCTNFLLFVLAVIGGFLLKRLGALAVAIEGLSK